MNKELPILNKSLVSKVFHSLLERFIREKSPKSTANIDVFCELEVRDKDGRLLSYKKFKSKSFTSFFLSYLKNTLIWSASSTFPMYRTISGVFGDGFADAGTNAILQMLVIDAADTGAALSNEPLVRFDTKAWLGSYFPTDGWIPPLAIGATQGDDSYGIQIGTGTTTPTNTDVRLTSKLPNSSMNYGATTFDSTITLQSSTVAIYKIARSFTNATASAITVSEAGIVAKIACRDTTNNNNVFGAVLIIHDTFASQTVPSGAVLTVRYTIQITT